MNEKQDDNLGRALRNKIVKMIYIFYICFLGGEYDWSDCGICVEKLYWKNIFLFKVSLLIFI